MNVPDIFMVKAKSLNGNWVEGLPATKDGKWYISNNAGSPFAFEINPETICRSVGKRDTFGNLMYLNDFVYEADGAKNGFFFHINWNEDSLMPVFEEYGENGKYYCGNWDYGEISGAHVVIGNSVDNPEFFKTGFITDKTASLIDAARCLDTLDCHFILNYEGGIAEYASIVFGGEEVTIPLAPDVDKYWQVAEYAKKHWYKDTHEETIER